MDSTKLVMEYLEARRQKAALAAEFKLQLEPLCARIKELEAQIEGCTSCDGGCHTEPATPKLTLVH